MVGTCDVDSVPFVNSMVRLVNFDTDGVLLRSNILVLVQEILGHAVRLSPGLEDSQPMVMREFWSRVNISLYLAPVFSILH